jgi:S1-C subfamily serine protease
MCGLAIPLLLASCVANARIDNFALNTSSAPEFLNGCASAAAHAETANAFLCEKTLKPSVRVEVRFDSAGREYSSYGSGVVIACSENGGAFDVLVLTAARVARSHEDCADRRICVETFENSSVTGRYEAMVAACDKTADLALLKFKSPLRLSCARMVPAEMLRKSVVFDEVFAVGCRLGMPPAPSDGIVSAESAVPNSRLWITSACAIFGNSGGGVFLKSTGELLGIVIMVAMVRTELLAEPGGEPLGGAVLHPVSHIGFFLPASEVRAFLDKSGFGWICAEQK